MMIVPKLEDFEGGDNSVSIYIYIYIYIYICKVLCGYLIAHGD